MRRKTGFTLIELLVVIGIIAILVGLTLPAVQKVRQSAARTQCQNNLKQIGLALHAYHDANQFFPPGYVSGVNNIGDDTGPGWGWAAYILPYLEQEPLFRTIDFQQRIEFPVNAAARVTYVKSYLCPIDPVPSEPFPVGPRSIRTGGFLSVVCTLAPANYVGSFGIGEPGVDGDGLFFRNSAVKIGDVTDGTSSTLIVGERSFKYSQATWVGAVTGTNLVPTESTPTSPGNQRRFREQGGPPPADGTPFFQIDVASNFVLAHTADSPFGPALATEVNHFTSQHGQGSNFLFVDGHVSFLGRSVTPQIYNALATRAGGESIPTGDY